MRMPAISFGLALLSPPIPPLTFPKSRVYISNFRHLRHIGSRCIHAAASARLMDFLWVRPGPFTYSAACKSEKIASQASMQSDWTMNCNPPSMWYRRISAIFVSRFLRRNEPLLILAGGGVGHEGDCCDLEVIDPRSAVCQKYALDPELANVLLRSTRCQAARCIHRSCQS